MKIGLEAHVQLTTKSKIFCGCPTRQAQEPNTHTCDTCLGFPGSKPRVNIAAIDAAVRIALALNCTTARETAFSRKTYFYPDLAKNFQITQYEAPIGTHGNLVINSKKIKIKRVHIEEDPARLIHVSSGQQHTLVDYNRSGIPLCEIVTEPDIGSPKEARLFLQQLSSMLEYMRLFDPTVEGSLRVDANVSVDETRVEVKNISGFKDVERALTYEIIRQQNALRRGAAIERETRGWDADSGTTKPLRGKEEEEEYGYITDTDLPVITFTAAALRKARQSLPEFAHEKVARYTKTLHIQKEVAASIVSDPDLATAFETVIKKTDKQMAARWFAQTIKKTLNYASLRMKDTRLNTDNIEKILKLVETKKVTEKTAELMLRETVKTGDDPEKLLHKSRASRIYDEKVIRSIVQDVIGQNATAVVDIYAGKNEAFNFLVGQVMRKTQGRADPITIRKVLAKMLGAEGKDDT